MSPSYYRFGLDYLRFNFGAKEEIPFLASFFHGFSTNSNEKYQVNFWDKSFEIQFLGFSHKQIILFSYFGDVVFELVKILDAGLVMNMSYTFTFYSTYFYVDDLKDFLSRFLVVYGDKCQVSRCDIALDVPVSVDYFWQNHVTGFRKRRVFENGTDIETFYLGSKVNNPKHFIRVYNKKLDSLKKGKFHLFYQYLSEPVVTRIELQLNIESCKMFGVDSAYLFSFLQDEKLLWSVFNTCCRNPYGTLFRGLEGIENSEIRQCEKKKPKKGDLIEIDCIPYAKIMLGYARRLHKLGFDVIGYLEKNMITQVVT